MKFLIFSDFHYEPPRFLCTGVEGIRHMQRRAEEEGCDFIMQAGDFCHSAKDVPELLEAYNNFHIPSYHVLGNHDAEFTPYEKTVALYGMPNEYYHFDVGGYRMIILNPNYYRDGSSFVHFSMANWLQHNTERDWFPKEQLDWLEKTIADSPYPCVIVRHQSLERVDGVKNRQAALDIINAANKRKKHSVILCINGHYHRDNLRVMEGVCYLDLNGASSDWIEKRHHCYPDELHEKVTKLHHLIVNESPLYAVIELTGTTIDIKGSETEMLCGVTYRDVAGSDGYDRCGRPWKPRIDSNKITLE